MNRKDVSNLETLDAIVLIKSPVLRIKTLLYTTSMTLNGFIDRYKDTDCMLQQSSFIEGLKINGTINLEAIKLQVEEELERELTEFERISNWYFHSRGIEPSMMQQWNLSIEDEQRINDIFKGDITNEL